MIKSLTELDEAIKKGQQFEILDTKSGEWVRITISADETEDFWEVVEVSVTPLRVKQVRS